jgi:hypothetical protein
MSARQATGWLAAAAFWLNAAVAAEPKSVDVDTDFLEFLGTFEPQDDGIDEYLASQVVSRAARRVVAPAPADVKELSK